MSWIMLRVPEAVKTGRVVVSGSPLSVADDTEDDKVDDSLGMGPRFGMITQVILSLSSLFLLSLSFSFPRLCFFRSGLFCASLLYFSFSMPLSLSLGVF